jgi:UDP-N-acetylglucosamine 2-epimerase (non-hydrolysing)
MPQKILIAFGTRPEAIKLAPVVERLRREPESFEITVVLTGQHRELVDPILKFFEITPDHDLDVMRPGQSPSEVTVRVLEAIEPVYRQVRPDRVIVQGDTTSAFAAALDAHYLKIPVAHVEAGLRTGQRYDPFPEEMNRRLITQLADMHFAATEGNQRTLLYEGVDPGTIHVTGNPIIDALEKIVAAQHAQTTGASAERDLIVLTAHRRENFGEPLANIYRAVNRIVEEFPTVEVVYPMHPNPSVIETAKQHLKDHPRIRCIEPLDYISFVRMMSTAKFIMTDSGGIQEEAPALGKPVLVMRRTTERSEVLESGNGLLVGIDEDTIVQAARRLLTDREHYARMSNKAYPFGQGDAADRIAEILLTVVR